MESEREKEKEKEEEVRKKREKSKRQGKEERPKSGVEEQVTNYPPCGVDGDEVWPEFVSFLKSVGDRSLEICFDGACRGQGSQVTAAAAAVVIHAIDAQNDSIIFPFQRIIDTTTATNNKAELTGAIMALSLVHWITRICPERTQFVIKGDSTYVTMQIQRGHLEVITTQPSDQVNWREWSELRRLHTSLPHGSVVRFVWIPRSLNASADRAANDAIDGKDCDITYHQQRPPVIIDLPLQTREIELFWSSSRRPTCRFLSHNVQGAWRLLFFNLLQAALASDDGVTEWSMLLSAPLVFLFPQHRQHQRQFLAQNINYATAMETFRNTVLSSDSQDLIQRPPMTKEQQATKLLSHGKIARACEVMEGKQGEIVRPTVEDLQKWPMCDDELPSFNALPDILITYGQISAASRRLRSLKSPDVLGWTKELWMPIIEELDDTGRHLLEMLFTRILHRRLPKTCLRMISTDMGMFIRQDIKKRPVVVSSLFGKILWHMSFMEVPQAFPAQSVGTAVAQIQSVLDAGNYVLKLDAANAFFSITRRAIFDSIADLDAPLLKHMWNSTYAHANPILVLDGSGSFLSTVSLRRGVKAGCVSASKLFIRALSRQLSTEQLPALHIVDDVYVSMDKATLKPQLDWVHEALCRIGARTGLDFGGPKKMLIAPTPPPTDFPVPHTCSPLHILGALVNPTALPIDAAVRAFLAPILRLMSTIEESSLSLQCKLLLVRNAYSRVRHFVSNTHVAALTPLICEFDDQVLQVVRRAVGVESMPQAHNALIQLPVEQGGLGIGYASLMRDHWFAKAIVDANTHFNPSFSSNRPSPSLGHLESETEALRKIIEAKCKTSPLLDSMLISKGSRQAHILKCFPTFPYVLPDTWVRATIFAKLAYIPPSFASSCTLKDDETTFSHTVTCSRCRQGTLRHNAVLYQMTNCFPKAGIPVQTSPTHLPLPKKKDEVDAVQSLIWQARSVTGPDAVVHTDEQHCLDLTVVCPSARRTNHAPRNAMERAEADKRRCYEEWQKQYRMKCHPVVMTTNGLFAPSASRILDEYSQWTGHRWFTSHVQLQMQKALCRIQHSILSMLSHRSVCLSNISSIINPRKKSFALSLSASAPV